MARPERRLRPGSPAAFALVAAGGAVGGLLRYAATLLWPDAVVGFAWTTWTINGLGSFALALLVVGVVRGDAAWWLRPTLGTGLIGGFPTFSAVTHALDVTLRAGAGPAAVAYLLGSLAVGVLGAVAGTAVGSRWPVARR